MWAPSASSREATPVESDSDEYTFFDPDVRRAEQAEADVALPQIVKHAKTQAGVGEFVAHNADPIAESPPRRVGGPDGAGIGHLKFKDAQIQAVVNAVPVRSKREPVSVTAGHRKRARHVHGRFAQKRGAAGLQDPLECAWAHMDARLRPQLWHERCVDEPDFAR